MSEGVETMFGEAGTRLKVAPDLQARFPGLQARIHMICDVTVKRENPELAKFRAEITIAIKTRYRLETLKDGPSFRAYRDFFWRVGIDPTKTRPAAEALIRRVLGGGSIPAINTVVDAYNLASMDTEVALAAFDAQRLLGDLEMRSARKSELFLGIGMEKPVELTGVEVVVADAEKLVAIYPYRDSEDTKVTTATTEILLMVCGVPGISDETLERAGTVAVEYIAKFCARGR